jgi:drug/metabolite transporter (DMT)-like permease
MELYYLSIALLISLLWGIHPVVMKYLLGKYSPTTLLLFSSGVYFYFVATVAMFRRKELNDDLKKMTFKDTLILVGLAIVSVFLANSLYYYVLKENSSSITSALIFSAPAFTLVLSYLFLKEKLSLYGLLGVISIILGVIFISQN